MPNSVALGDGELADHGREVNLQRLAVELVDERVDAVHRIGRAEDDDRVGAVVGQQARLADADHGGDVVLRRVGQGRLPRCRDSTANPRR